MNEISRREFGLAGGVVALAVGSGGAVIAQSAVGAPPTGLEAQMRPPADAQLQYVHPELRAIRASQLRHAGDPAPPSRAPSPLLDTPPVVERMIPAAKGAPDVHAFIVNAVPDQPPKPVILHMHGGGMVSGDARRGVPNLQRRCLELDCAAVTIDYRLAPQTRYPGQVDDAYAALTWIYAHAAELNVDCDRIAVIGESAGGGLAAMLAIMARDRGEVPVLFQALMYPMLDDRYGSRLPLPPHIDATANSSWQAFLGIEPGSDAVPYGIPGRLADLRGLPPAFVSAGSIDPLVFGSLDYARRLMEAGILVELLVVPGAYHAFNAVDSSLARQFNAAYYEAIGRAFKWGR